MTAGSDARTMANRTNEDVLDDLQRTLDSGKSGIFDAWEAVSRETLAMRERADAVANGLAQQREALEKLLQEAAAQLDAVRSRRAQEDGAVQEAQARIVELEAALAGSDERHEALETALRGVESRALEAEAAAAESAQGIEIREKRIAELERHIGQEASATASARERVQAMEQQLAEATAALQQAQAETVRLEKEVDSHRQQGEQAAAAEAARREELGQTQEQLKKLQAELTTAQQAIAGAGHENAELREALQQAQQEAHAAQEKAELLEEQMRDENARGTKSLLATQLAEALQDADNVRQELRAVRRELEQFRRKAGTSADDEIKRVREAAQRLGNGHKRAIGELLVEAGILTQEQVDQTMEEQKRKPALQLGSLLVEKRLASPEAVAQALAYQCDAEFIRFDNSTIDGDAPQLITERLASKHTCIPIRATDDEIVVAMANPGNLVAIEDIERAANRKVDIVVGTENEIRDAIAQYYVGASF